jgi:acetyl esterase/lipase
VGVLVLLLIALALLACLCLWIVVPPPNATAIIATVVAIELSPYLLVLNALLLFAAIRSRARVKWAAVAVATVNIVLCALPLGALIASGVRPVFPSAAPNQGSVIEMDIPVTLGHDRTAIRAYLPAAGANHPIVFVIYGGAWRNGTPANDAWLNRGLAADGDAVFALDYRHAPANRFPDALDDVKSEIALIVAHAAQYRADARRMAVLGHSSGGQLAELCAFAPHAPFRALISYSGAIDLLKGYEIVPKPDPIDVRGVIGAYMGSTPAQKPQDYREASPIDHVRSGLPPTLLIYGTRDHVVDFGFAMTFRDALRRDGDEVTFVTLPWTEHGFEDVPFGLHAPIALRAVKDFLHKVL